MAKKFSQDAIHVSAPAGTEHIMAMRVSDSEMIYFTPTELLNALLKLNTINGQSLFGNGNLTIGGSMTATQIKAALNIITLSGSNTGDQDLSPYRLKTDTSGLSDQNFTLLLKQKLDSLNNTGGSSLPSDFWITQEGAQVINPTYLPYNTSLSPTQFEQVSDGIGLKGFANIGSGGGTTTQPAMTSSMIVDNDTNNTRTLQNLPSGKTYADVESSVNGGTSYFTHTSNAFAVGNIAAAAGQVLSRFKTNGSVLAGTPIANTIAFTVSGGGSTPTAERTLRLNFQNQYSSPPASSFTWNNLKPTNAQLAAAAGFVSANLVTETNAATTIKVTNTTALGDASAVVSGAYTTGLYPAEIVNSGWATNGNGNTYIITISGLNAVKYYTFLLAAVSENGATDAIIWTIGAKTAAQSPYRNFGVAGESEFTSAMWAKITNVQSDGSGNVAISINGTAGGFSKFISALIIQEYATAS